MKRIISLVAILCLAFASAAHAGKPDKKPRKGLSAEAAAELSAAGVDKYLGLYTPISSVDVGDGSVT